MNCQYGVGASATFRFTGAPNQLPGLVSVPNLVGSDYQQANQALSAAGLALQYSTTPVSVCPRPGIIRQQAPPAGTDVQLGSTVAGIACVPFTPPPALDARPTQRDNGMIRGIYCIFAVQ